MAKRESIKYTSILMPLIIFLIFSTKSILGQETPEVRTNRILKEINTLPNFPRLAPFGIKIENRLKKECGAIACYYKNFKNHFWSKKSMPIIFLNKEWVNYNSDDAIKVILTHELGHHYNSDHTEHAKLELTKPLSKPEKILDNYRRDAEDQTSAESFAFYILGEDTYKKGKLDYILSSYQKNSGVYWLYVESDPILKQYYIDSAKLWIDYWLSLIKNMPQLPQFNQSSK